MIPQNVYPSGFFLGKIYQTVKLDKLSIKKVDDLLLSPIVSNVKRKCKTSKAGKYLAKLLPPLHTSEYAISNTRTFVKQKSSSCI